MREKENMKTKYRTMEEKQEILNQFSELRKTMNTAEACRKLKITTNSIYTWRCELKKGSTEPKVVMYKATKEKIVKARKSALRSEGTAKLSMIMGTPEQIAQFMKEMNQ